MSDPETDIDIAEYVLGTLAPEQRAALEARLRADGTLRRTVEAWQRRLAPMAASVAPVAPPPALWDRIAGAVAAETDRGPRTVLRGGGAWTSIAPGVEMQTLVVDRELGFRTFLLRMQPGSELPAHPHDADEECLMLEGEISIGALNLRAGDWHLAPRGHLHPEIRSATGGLLYVRSALDEHAA